MKTLKIKRVRDVKMPTRGTQTSAGIDFYVPNDKALDMCIAPSQGVLIPSGIKVDIPAGYALIAFNKSGIATKRGFQVGACVVDEDYQGEVHIHLTNISGRDQLIESGEKIVQFLLLPVEYCAIEEVESIHEQETIRGAGGFGSTGLI